MGFDPDSDTRAEVGSAYRLQVPKRFEERCEIQTVLSSYLSIILRQLVDRRASRRFSCKLAVA